MQRINRVLKVPNVMLKCTQAPARTNSLNRILVVASRCAASRATTNSSVFGCLSEFRMTPRVDSNLSLSKRFYASGSLPEHIKILLPALSPTMEQGI